MNENNNKKTAKQHVEDVYSKLVESKACLREALNSAEQHRNKEQIENNLASVNDAINSVNNTLNNYQD
ncbi:hypothetical protein [Clostridium isatidis]|uniref:Uncharacterized protein n=1 Tax=Clostridium isatidis TaxID=182773 RepID=A0A343JCN2_9CLOT|nr:hypothetical protein [Clostridium isatidis]ASW43290.1 hypothetical protein BEN51_07270 [Clostridium isatidis]NLZ34574.1 hypothetical protein [Clostridiales bacterium]